MTDTGLTSLAHMENARRLRRGEEPEQSREEGFVDEAAARHVAGRVTNSNSPLAMELNGTLTGVFWRHQKGLLDLLELLARDDRQYQTAKRQAQDIMNAQLRQQASVVNAVIAAHLAAAEEAGDAS